jgi:hypothetical protein
MKHLSMPSYDSCLHRKHYVKLLKFRHFPLADEYDAHGLEFISFVINKWSKNKVILSDEFLLL